MDAIDKFVIRGTRGSMPACGVSFAKYGGNTTCFSIETQDGLLVIDAGTGVVHLNDDLSSRSRMPPITMLFTHFHLDHVIGLPCFAALYRRDASIRFMADPCRDDDWREILTILMASPYWPTSLALSKASKSFDDLPAGNGPIDICGLRVSWCPVFHPQRSLAYKIEGPCGVIVVATDHEHADSDVRAGFLEFCRGADCILYDAMYTPSEYATRNGWGHGNWQQGVQLAMEAQTAELILTHHHPTRTDTEIEEIVRLARKYFPNTRASMENMVVGS